MKLIDFLRKRGVLRQGVRQYTYSIGRDMTPEALRDDVHAAEND